MTNRAEASLIAGAAVLFLVIVVACLGLVSPGEDKSRRWYRIVVGVDGRLSTSKFQWWLWTLVACFGFVEVFVERMLVGHVMETTTMPPNLLIAMGFTAVTLTAAKGITVSHLTNGMVDKTPSPGPKSAPKEGETQTQLPPVLKGGILTDDDGIPDLSKIQMLAFTAIAVFVYIARLVNNSVDKPEVVDIDSALMVLMGLGQGAYLGKKLTSTLTCRITGITPAGGPENTPVTLVGADFGDAQAGGVILLDGQTVDTVPDDWKDTSIKFKWPSTRADGTKWTLGDRVPIGLVLNGRPAEGTVFFTVRA